MLVEVSGVVLEVLYEPQGGVQLEVSGGCSSRFWKNERSPNQTRYEAG